jgi:hypothetical protein
MRQPIYLGNCMYVIFQQTISLFPEQSTLVIVRVNLTPADTETFSAKTETLSAKTETFFANTE